MNVQVEVLSHERGSRDRDQTIGPVTAEAPNIPTSVILYLTTH